MRAPSPASAERGQANGGTKLSQTLSKLRAAHRRNPQQDLIQEAIIEILELRIELRDALQVGYGEKTKWPKQALALLEEEA